jgi:hypothetical protein
MKKKIYTISGGRFISHHPGKVDVYYDSRGRVIKSDGSELVEDLQPEPIINNDWPKRSYRPQLETCSGNLIEFKLDALIT